MRSLPVHRERALTLPLSTPKLPPRGWRKQKTQKTKDQSQCLFLTKLNYDIRRLIYEHVLCPPQGRELHVAVGCYGSNRSPGPSGFRLCAIPCYAENPDESSCRHRCWAREDLFHHARRNSFSPKIPDEFLISLSILRSCRQIYIEAIEVLYSANTLNIRQLRAMVHLPNVMVPNRLSSIRSLHLDPFPADSSSLEPRAHPTPEYFIPRWRESCAIISKIDGLQNLRVDFRFDRLFWEFWFTCGARSKQDANLCSLIEPLLKLRVPNFRVTLYNWLGDVSKARKLMMDSDARFLLEETRDYSDAAQWDGSFECYYPLRPGIEP